MTVETEIEIPSLADVDPSLVSQELAIASGWVQEVFPDLDLRRGVYYDTVLYSHSILAAAERTNINRYLSARSLMQIQADPTLADSDITDDVLSTWGITRQQGTAASGNIIVVLSKNTMLVLSAGTPFTANGQSFVTTQLFTGVPTAAMVRGPSDVLLTPMSDGNYAFTISVTAVNSGAASNVPQGTLFTPNYLPTSYVTAYAASDFSNGADTETNAQLISRLAQGIAAQGGQNVFNMAGLLRQQSAFSRFQAMSVMGYGDAEMLRDRHTIFPVSYGGRMDWYIRTQLTAQTDSYVKTATLVGLTPENYGIWQVSFANTDCPGFYEVQSIQLNAANNVSGSFPIQSDVRGLNLTGNNVPDIETVAEGVYSTYQTATIQFIDNLTPTANLALGATQNYVFLVSHMPLIDAIQLLVNSFNTRCRPADTLVKAPVPCFVQLSFTIYHQADQPDPDLNAITAALVNAVNGVGFIGRLYSSPLIDVIHGFLDSTSSLGAIDMLGRIRYPDGSIVYLRDPVLLQVPDDPARMVTANTVQFFLGPDNVSISIEADVPLPA